jgi:hypothetical protein
VIGLMATEIFRSTVEYGSVRPAPAPLARRSIVHGPSVVRNSRIDAAAAAAAAAEAPTLSDSDSDVGESSTAVRTAFTLAVLE